MQPGTIMEQQFSLSWREFQGNLSNGCSHLLASGDFADVTLAIEGRLLKAHRLVLSICSPFFQRMFHSNPCQHPIVVLKDISYNAMRDLLQFMYNGEVSVKQEDLTSLISTAETLEVKGLTNKTNNQENNNDLPSNLSTKNKNSYFNDEPIEDESNKIVNNFIPPANHNPKRQIEFLDRLSKLASLKRKCDNILPKTFHSENHSQPEKRVKLREKLILNRHKISKLHNKIPLNAIINDKNKIDEPVISKEHEQTGKERIKSPKISYNPVKTTNGQESCDSISIPENNIEEVKEENETTEKDESAIEETSVKDNTAQDLESIGNHIQPSPSPRRDQDGGLSYSESPLAPWPGSTFKGYLPFSEHKIITIPQKEDGKKKYPQKSCRYCWRAGRRRDTRFMCEQCCVPLCKLVCFEKHQTGMESFAVKDEPNLSIANFGSAKQEKSDHI